MMTPHPIRRSGLLLLAMLTPLASLRAEESAPRELLRDALYAEEVTRDPAKAAESYQKVLELYEAERPFAATALFRLAEVRRKQGKNEESVKLYQRLLQEFPAAEVEGKLARENLAALGGALPDAMAPAAALNDAESKELLRLQELARTSPDLARDPTGVHTAARLGQLRVLTFLIDSGIDPKSDDFLSTAVLSGNLKVVELLLSKGCDPATPPNDKALLRAVESGYNSIAELLLKSGAKANYHFEVKNSDRGYTASTSSLLHVAARQGDERMCRLLLDHGADLNFMPPLCFPQGDSSEMPVGSPLHQAINGDSKRSGSMATMLMKAGAKPDLAASGSGLTPLHLAASRGNVAVMRALLDAGAAIDPRSKMPEPPPPPAGPMGSPWSSHQAGRTPLHYAVYNSESEEAVRLLLSKGSDPSASTASGSSVLSHALSGRKPKDYVKLLVDGGAKVKSPNELVNASYEKSLEVVELLLAAGADVNAISSDSKMTPLQAAVGANSSAEIVSFLIDRGGKIDNAALRKALDNNGAKESIRELLYDRFVLPDLLSKPAVTLTFSRVSGFQRTLATREGDPGPASLEALLLRVDSLPFVTGTSHLDPQVFPHLITIYRREPGGSVRKISARIDGAVALPKLEWGDVVELGLDPESFENGIPNSFNFSYQRIKSPELFWKLRKQLTTPVVAHIEGKAREMTLRGDCLVYHPGEPVAPLLPASGLAEVLWSQISPDYLTIRRAGWPEIRIDKGNPEWLQFEFQAGDEIKPGYKEDPAVTEAKMRKGRILLRVPGTGFGRPYWLVDPQDIEALDRSGFGTRSVTINAPTIPTLVELLTDSYAGMPRRIARTIPDAPDGRWGEIAARQLGMTFGSSSGGSEFFHRTPLVPQDPDFSKIRILRLSADGKETAQEVDLTKAIAATTDATAPEEVRRGDVALQAGDIVEFPLKPQSEGKAWTGFSEAEVRFFSKALGGNYQFSDNSGNISRKNLMWQPVKWLSSPCGPVPLPPDSGTASTSTWFQDEIGSSTGIKLMRGEAEEKGMDRGFFIRDGDRIRVTDPNVPRPPRTRPAVVPPPR